MFSRFGYQGIFCVCPGMFLSFCTHLLYCLFGSLVYVCCYLFAYFIQFRFFWFLYYLILLLFSFSYLDACLFSKREQEMVFIRESVEVRRGAGGVGGRKTTIRKYCMKKLFLIKKVR